jgi:hypothetical protein
MPVSRLRIPFRVDKQRRDFLPEEDGVYFGGVKIQGAFFGLPSPEGPTLDGGSPVSEGSFSYPISGTEINPVSEWEPTE